MAGRNKTISEKFNSPFAKSIRSLMEERGMTQDELAQAVGRTRQTVSQYVNGISEPGYDTLVKIADSFNVSVDFLLGRTDAKTVDPTMQSIIHCTGLSEYSVRSLVLDSTDDHITARLINDILEIKNLLPHHLLLVQESKHFQAGREHGTSLDDIQAAYMLYQDAACQGMAPIRQSDYMRFLSSEVGNTIAEGLRKKYIPGYDKDNDHGHD